MRVADVMTGASITESPAESLRNAAAVMWKRQTGSLLIMNGDDVAGIVTERDLMKAVARGDDLDATPVSAVMTRQVLTVAPDTSIAEAACCALLMHSSRQIGVAICDCSFVCE